MTLSTFPWVKAFFILTTIILAGLKLLAEIVTEKQKEQIINKIALVKAKLDNWTPRAYFEMFSNRWLIGILQFCLCLAFLSPVMHQIMRSRDFIFTQFTDRNLQAFLNWYYGAVAYTERYFAVQVILAIFIASIRNDKGSDQDLDFSPEKFIGDGSLLKFWVYLIKGILSLLIYAALYWVCYLFSNLEIENVLYEIFRFFSVLFLMFAPLFYFIIFIQIIFNSFAALLVILFSYISNVPVFFLRHVFNWIYNNPKKAWAVMLASLALVLTLDKIPTLFINS